MRAGMNRQIREPGSTPMLISPAASSRTVVTSSAVDTSTKRSPERYARAGRCGSCSALANRAATTLSSAGTVTAPGVVNSCMPVPPRARCGRPTLRRRVSGGPCARGTAGERDLGLHERHDWPRSTSGRHQRFPPGGRADASDDLGSPAFLVADASAGDVDALPAVSTLSARCQAPVLLTVRRSDLARRLGLGGELAAGRRRGALRRVDVEGLLAG